MLYTLENEENGESKFAQFLHKYVNTIGRGLNLNEYRVSRIDEFSTDSEALCEWLLYYGRFDDFFVLVNVLMELYDRAMSSPVKINDVKSKLERMVALKFAKGELIKLIIRTNIHLNKKKKETLKFCDTALMLARGVGLNGDDEAIKELQELKERALNIQENSN